MNNKEHFQSHLDYAIKAIALYMPFNLYAALKIKIIMDETSDPHYGSTDGIMIFMHYPACLTLDKPRFTGILEHELDHILNLHMPRKGVRKMQPWNIAADIPINDGILKNEKTTNNHIIISRDLIFAPHLAHLATEEIYDIIMSGKDPMFRWKEAGEGDEDDEGEGGCLMYSPGPGKPFKKMPSDMKRGYADPSEIEQFQKNLLRESKASNPGADPKGIERAAFDLLDVVKVDWKKELKYYVTRGLKDYSFSERDRRFWSSPFFIPGMEESPNGSISIGVGIDLSGSVSQKDIKIMLTECVGIERSYPVVKFWFIPFDVKTYGRFESNTKAEVFDAFKKFKGGGGTSFVKVLEELDAIKDSKLSIIFTDMMGTFPKKKPKKPLIWLDFLEKGSKEEIPYGRRIKYHRT